MPLYEYECDACGKRFEVIQKFSEVSTECRRCGKGPVRRLMSSPAIPYKGSGFYINDYAQKGKSGESSSDSKSDSGDSAKSDSASKSDSATSDSAKKTESPSPAPTTTAAKD